ncbi:MAG: hypothetical protein C4524_12980 [Candidatus Zixiibacteriota bacterium]|nr:MAG: hypothetical protein C4524_12980 [candidate division Zixibacteria bacterium]
MAFNPLKEKGIPMDQQPVNWATLNVTPYDKNSVHPYTRTRIILMNGIEVEAAIFKHQFARHTDDMELKRQLAMSRRIEQQQQKMINWLPPGDESPLSVTIGYEQVAVDLTAWLARTEPDPYVKEALDFALIEDFDHLYRYANLLQMTEGKEAEEITREYTEIMPGRPTIAEHRHPYDSIRKHYDSKKAQMITKLHVMTIISAEQQTMNYYMNIGPLSPNPMVRALYQEIAMIEEQHVSHYESLADPKASWFEMALLHEYNECYMYYSCMTSETDNRIRDIWQLCLEQEITHLQHAGEMLKKYEKRDPAQIIPEDFPELTIFQSNKDYIRRILANQINLTADGTEFKSVDSLPSDHRYHQYQSLVNGDGFVPSRDVIEENVRQTGNEYRLETEGPHPVEWLRTSEEVTI